MRGVVIESHQEAARKEVGHFFVQIGQLREEKEKEGERPKI